MRRILRAKIGEGAETVANLPDALCLMRLKWHQSL